MYYESEFECKMCGSEEAEALGTLGARMYLRCRACGADQFVTVLDDEFDDEFETGEA